MNDIYYKLSLKSLKCLYRETKYTIQKVYYETDVVFVIKRKKENLFFTLASK